MPTPSICESAGYMSSLARMNNCLAGIDSVENIKGLGQWFVISNPGFLKFHQIR
jgi:hypothetical protein